MDKAIISDLLVSNTDADLAIKNILTELEACPEDEHSLLKWYQKTIKILDGAFASGATHYFEEMGGFEVSHYYDGTAVLEEHNKGRAFGILKRMRDGLSELRQPSNDKSMENESPSSFNSDNKSIFIVHGHDEAIRGKVAAFLRAIGLIPIVLADKASSGMTIIEKIEKHGDVGFAVVLMTPDDLGNDTSNAKSGELETRPRQNVLIEFGYFWGRLGRERVCLLNAIGDNVSSDLKGLGYVSLDKSSGWKIELGKELKAARYSINTDAIFD